MSRSILAKENEKGDAEAHIPTSVAPVGPHPSVSLGGFKPSAKLRARIVKLQHKKMDPSWIHIPGGACEFGGGHATVSGACMYNWRDIDVAIKKPRIADDTDLERVLGSAIREAEFLAELDHPNIVRLEGLIEDVPKGIFWLVFPWARNGNLKDFISSREWEIPERISLINDVAQGLAYLHDQKPPICHGDLKSLNVLVDRSHRAAITDFGSARRLANGDPDTQIEQVESGARSAEPLRATFCASANTITLTGNEYTLRWAAPELLNDDQGSLWSDIWALGWIAYEVMTNSFPFQDALTDVAVVERVLGGQLPSLTDSAHLSSIIELCSLMNMCWRNNPIERPTAGSCQKLIHQMPMFAPETDSYGTNSRVLGTRHLSELGHMYQSRDEYGRASHYFFEALERSRGQADVQQRLSCLRDLARLHRLREQYSEEIALYSEVWSIYPQSMKTFPEDTADILCDLSQLHQLRNESSRTIELDHRERETQEEERIAKALCEIAEQHLLQSEYDHAIRRYSQALQILTDLGNGIGRANALRALADVHRHRRDYTKAIQLYNEVLEICTDIGNRRTRADALCGLATLHRHQREYAKAIPLYYEVLQIWAALDNREKRADALWGLAEVYRLKEGYDEAIPLYNVVLQIWTDLGNRESRVDALRGLAKLHRLQGEYDKAIPLYSEISQICAALGDKEGRADALWGLTEAHRQRGEYDKTIPLYSEVLKIRSGPGDRKERADALYGLAGVHRRRGENDKAIPLYYEALQIWTDLGDRENRADVLRVLAKLHRLQEEYDRAISLSYQVLQVWTDLSDRENRADALRDLAELHRLRGEYGKAISLYSEVLNIRSGAGDRKERADDLWSLAELHRLRSEYDKTIPLYLEALNIRTDLGDRKGMNDALWGLAELHRLQEEYDKAIPFYYEALKIRTKLGNKEGRAAVLLRLADARRHQNRKNDPVRLSNEAAQGIKELAINHKETAVVAVENAVNARQLLQPQDSGGRGRRHRNWGLKSLLRGIMRKSVSP